jgi:hypothetical protein
MRVAAPRSATSQPKRGRIASVKSPPGGLFQPIAETRIQHAFARRMLLATAPDVRFQLTPFWSIRDETDEFDPGC